MERKRRGLLHPFGQVVPPRGGQKHQAVIFPFLEPDVLAVQRNQPGSPKGFLRPSGLVSGEDQSEETSWSQQTEGGAGIVFDAAPDFKPGGNGLGMDRFGAASSGQ